MKHLKRRSRGGRCTGTRSRAGYRSARPTCSGSRRVCCIRLFIAWSGTDFSRRIGTRTTRGGARSSMLSWQGSGGFSIDASVRIEGEDRAGVERLLRYCARPPFALERLYAPGGIVSLASPESKLVYRLPKPAPDGRTELLLSPLQLLERLATNASRRCPRSASPRPPPPVSRCPSTERQTACRRHVHRQTRSRNTRRPAPEPNEPEPKAAALPRC